MAAKVHDVVQARCFELVGDDGQVLATIAPIGAGFAAGCARFELSNAAGTTVVRITAYPESGEVLVARADDPNAITSIDAHEGLLEALDTPTR